MNHSQKFDTGNNYLLNSGAGLGYWEGRGAGAGRSDQYLGRGNFNTQRRNGRRGNRNVADSSWCCLQYFDIHKSPFLSAWSISGGSILPVCENKIELSKPNQNKNLVSKNPKLEHKKDEVKAEKNCLSRSSKPSKKTCDLPQILDEEGMEEDNPNIEKRKAKTKRQKKKWLAVLAKQIPEGQKLLKDLREQIENVLELARTTNGPHELEEVVSETCGGMNEEVHLSSINEKCSTTREPKSD
ncbi:hypothetical protein QYM36_002704 [Artemia franciscana]|uniref:Uncharacterized protein n=1 Tax=Artemia franciscana TaxID=6661 RepID=A0AA88II42_ARTSF|nr:hypothetical protein QYM36_002704 [Artemia franciscana]